MPRMMAPVCLYWSQHRPLVLSGLFGLPPSNVLDNISWHSQHITQEPADLELQSTMVLRERLFIADGHVYRSTIASDDIWSHESRSAVPANPAKHQSLRFSADRVAETFPMQRLRAASPSRCCRAFPRARMQPRCVSSSLV